jgi:hypothetical protein
MEAVTVAPRAGDVLGNVVEREKKETGTVQRGKATIGDKDSVENVEDIMGRGLVHSHVVFNANVEVGISNVCMAWRQIWSMA